MIDTVLFVLLIWGIFAVVFAVGAFLHTIFDFNEEYKSPDRYITYEL